MNHGFAREPLEARPMPSLSEVGRCKEIESKDAFAEIIRELRHEVYHQLVSIEMVRSIEKHIRKAVELAMCIFKQQ